MELRELQLEELNILKKTLKIIERHKLRYFMLGGTFLGAVRHKGFIPWDDDIDIGLPREDYEKFAGYAAAELEEPYALVTFENTESHNDFCNRVVNKKIILVRDDALTEKHENLWIDIFPLDGMPNNRFARSIHKFNLLLLRLLLQYSKFKNGVNIKKRRSVLESFLIKIGFVVSKRVRFNVKKRLNSVDKSLRRYPYENSDYVVNFMGAYKFKEMFPRALYEDLCLYDFEDMQLCAPKDYDAVLSQLYGDYMTPPETEGRISHSVKVLGKENE